ncbi:hypothetical protein SLS55_002550 [Diplodia seriata]|uniref:Uncharacterized protein n=1 Tax=Diplodia seriata TaxID=420778 RepID=A0ABR3CSH4_9PEZI
MNKFFKKVTADRLVMRVNWGINEREELFFLDGTHLYEGDEASADPNIDIDQVQLRVERQVLRRLPKSGAICMLTKTYLYRLVDIAKEPGVAARLGGMLHKLPEKFAFYKRKPVWGNVVLAYLDEMAVKHPALATDAYSQCQPGTASTTLATSATPTTTTVTAPTNGSTATGPGTTLQAGYLWIRAVEDPNFHKYLQSGPDPYAAGTAVIDVYTQAGQFALDADGQLAQLVSAPGETPEKFLYAHVAGGATRDGRTLAVTFAADKGTYGTFAWQGDALTWSAANVTRPNLSAWYVCEEQALFVNLGNYLYETPDGCADETIHYYNDATAND